MMSMMAKLMMMMTLIMAISGAATLFPTVSIMWAAFRVSSRALKQSWWQCNGDDGNGNDDSGNDDSGNDENGNDENGNDENGNDDNGNDGNDHVSRFQGEQSLCHYVAVFGPWVIKIILTNTHKSLFVVPWVNLLHKSDINLQTCSISILDLAISCWMLPWGRCNWFFIHNI